MKEEFFFRAHSGWIEGSHVLSEVWEDYPGLTEQINLPGPSWELPFRERGMVIGDDGDSWWVRWQVKSRGVV